jgi:hypothetical protein
LLYCKNGIKSLVLCYRFIVIKTNDHFFPLLARSHEKKPFESSIEKSLFTPLCSWQSTAPKNWNSIPHHLRKLSFGWWIWTVTDVRLNCIITRLHFQLIYHFICKATMHTHCCRTTSSI